MPIEILLPPLSQTMDTLVLVEWLKQVGEPVTKGEALFRVETDKAELEVESPGTGLLQSALFQPGDEIKIHSVIGTIAEMVDTPDSNQPAGPSGEQLPANRLKRVFASPRARQLAVQRGVSLVDLQDAATGPQGMIVERDVLAYMEQAKNRPRATPVAQRMAEFAGVSLSDLAPTRPGATITKADVAASLQSRDRQVLSSHQAAAGISQPVKTPEQAVSQRVPLTPTRRTIARRMVESHLTTAPVTYLREVDATRLVRLRDRILKNLSADATRPTYTDFLARMLCLALQKHPDLNATFDGETLQRFDSIHLALAVDVPRGLIVPVIQAAQDLGVLELARVRHELIDRAMSGTSTPEELTGGTFTLSNLGALGVDLFTPILNPPQVAILGVGRVHPAPAVHKGKLRIRQLLGLALSCDHRVIDGAPAARFLQEVASLIENPDLVWL